MASVDVDMPAVEAVRSADLPALLAALAQATGDTSILRADLRPDPARVIEPQSGLSREQRQTARESAVEVLERLAEQPPGGIEPLRSAAELRPLFDFLVGEPVDDDLAALLFEELGEPGVDARAPDWCVHDIAPGRTVRAAIVGAGMSGIAAAHRLSQAGVDVVVFDKNAGPGGTWFENRYPGCRVDVPNYLYSYSFRQRADWPQRFTTQAGLLEYFTAAAADLCTGVDMRYGTEVVSAVWRERESDWEITTRSAAGEEVTHVDVLVSAVGQLNRPKLPDIQGRSDFAGPSFHSAWWDHTVDLAGRRIAVIGTGASAIQLVPELAAVASELHVYQRTPNWMMPTPDYHADTSAAMHWLQECVPFYAQWYRLSLFWRLADGVLPAARVDPSWKGPKNAVSERSDQLRAMLTMYIENQFADAPDLLPYVVPGYPPLAKRILLDDGIWATTIKRDNVTLVSDPIEGITPAGVVAAGKLREVDVIVYATGFRASEFLMPMSVKGRDGVDLHEHWAGEARAYLGLTIPRFPNLFCLYGPNTNLVANGSIIFFSECEVRYVLGAVRLLLDRDAHALECREDAHDEFNQRVDAANQRMAWGASTVNNWYRNASGRVTQNWPFTLLEFWQRTREPDPADFFVS